MTADSTWPPGASANAVANGGDSKSHKFINVKGILGGTIGGIAGLAVIAAMICFYLKRHQADIASGQHSGETQLDCAYTDIPRSRSRRTMRSGGTSRTISADVRKIGRFVDSDMCAQGYNTLYSDCHRSVSPLASHAHDN